MPREKSGAVGLWGKGKIQSFFRPFAGVALGPFDGNEAAGDEAIRPTEGVPIACIFKTVKVPVFESESSPKKRLAQSEGGTWDISCDA